MTDTPRTDVGPDAATLDVLTAAVATVEWDGDTDLLLARIQRSRADGERVLLPTADRPRVFTRPLTSRQRWLPRLVILAAGVVAITIIAVLRY